jgi:hypothetical protein
MLVLSACSLKWRGGKMNRAQRILTCSTIIIFSILMSYTIVYGIPVYNPPSYTKLDAGGNDLPNDAVSWVMVRDNVTGLIWEVKQNKDGTQNYSDPHDADNTYTWYDSNPETNGGTAGTPGDGTDTEDFINALNAANFGGFSDWRLPTIKELFSLVVVDSCIAPYTIEKDYFPNTIISYYTSSTPRDESAWSVEFDYPGRSTYSSKSNSRYVRAVRGRKSNNAFVDNENGTVTDLSTGLMWQQQQSDTWMDWNAAIDYCWYLDFAGYGLWRMPQKRELHSIVDFSGSYPAIDPIAFPDFGGGSFWTANENVCDDNRACSVYIGNGSVGCNGTKTSNNYVLAVIGGQDLYSGKLFITSPKQASAWIPGSVMEITWDTQGIPGNVKISISRDAGKSKETIAESTENDGSYTWTVTEPVSVNCMLTIEPLEPGYEWSRTSQGLFTIGYPAISAEPLSHDFGSIVLGSSCPDKTFTITNTGYGDLDISGVSITGTDSAVFQVVSDTCSGQTLRAMNTCTVEIEFCPTSSGVTSANLSISSNDPVDPLVELSLSGTGLDPGSLWVTPFEDFEISGFPGGPFSPSSKIYTLENTGDVPLDWAASKSAIWVDLSGVSGTLEVSGSTTVTVYINNDIIENFMLGTYEDTVIFFNTTNGSGNTTRDVILSVVKPPSTISCMLSSNDIVLGAPLTISGQIDPAPSESGAFVDVVFTPSFGQSIHRSTLANTLGEFSMNVYCGDIYKAGEWTVQTSWSGDVSLQGASSVGRELTVSKAESKVTLDVTSQAVKLGELVSIGGKFTPEPDCGGNLTEMIQITLFISGPGGTDIQYVQTNDPWGHFLLQDYDGLDALGEWTVQASFAGNDAYLPSSSDPIEVQVVETAGYAIVVQGKIASEEGLESHNKTAQFVYERLIDRGLLADDIMYFNYDYGNPGRPEIDALPTQAGIDDAITNWAMAKMNAKPANLYIIMLDHGLEDIFYIHPDAITATELDTWLDTLQASLIGQAAEQEIITILAFCRSGSFIDDVSGENRVIIASAAANESSYKGPLDEDGIREGEYFVSEFFKKVSFGKSVKECFEHATALTEVFTSSGTGESTNAPYYDDSLQHPLLDDNGDGEGSNDLSNPDGDGLLCEDLFIGVSSITGNDPGDVMVIETTDTQFLGLVENSVDLWARVDDNARLRVIWNEVKPPGYNPVDPGGSGQAEMDLVKTYGIWNSETGRYEWTDLGSGPGDPDFSDPGTYQVFYFAKDDDTGNVSPLMETRVYKAIDPNSPPYAFDLVSPADGAEVLTTFILDWEDTTDPEGDSFTYTVLVSEDDNSFSDPIKKEGLKYSTCLMGPGDGIKDLTDYFWKVQAIDEYGAIQETGVSQFATNNTNPTAAWIEGHVYNSMTGAPIANAIISVASLEFNTELNGYYIGTANPGTYTVSASADGYVQKSCPGVVFPDGGIVTRDFGLEPLTAGPSGAIPAILLLLLGE